MNIVTTTSVYPYPEISEIDILKRLAKIGFKHLDLDLCYMLDAKHPGRSENWREWVNELKELSEKLGVEYTHSHACGNAAIRGLAIERCFEICNLLGIKYTVIHPIHQKADGSFFNDDDEFVKVNADAYRGLLELAEKYQVVILTENILWEASSRIEAIERVVKEVDSKWFSWCFDTGHIHCLHREVSQLREMEIMPLSLHIHDNHGKEERFGKDSHLIPGYGNIDWKEFLDILFEKNYKGELVLEAHHQSYEAPDNERDAILADLLSRACKMREYIESKTK